jgi:hypothetical protein
VLRWPETFSSVPYHYHYHYCNDLGTSGCLHHIATENAGLNCSRPSIQAQRPTSQIRQKHCIAGEVRAHDLQLHVGGPNSDGAACIACKVRSLKGHVAVAIQA